ncbi:MAG: 1-deoxy-D-xylulose-5-phosphate synthase [Clostridia bacterium]|nr:1-deoxy-D-xylulose-5-phosphate synthase [Clostridia bacterium]
MSNGILGTINSPDDLKKLNIAQAEDLCSEIRDEIIGVISKNGGHLASSLGAVELTVAIHRSFNAPKDTVIFDVGHQSYAHKLVTGRYKNFDTIRKKDGLSGFMRPNESEYDPFVTGHSSNSISAAYGILRANIASGSDAYSVAVIGDGAMTGGMAYEALNNAGGKKGNFIVILNDNKMSISKNVGAVSRSFMRLRSGRRYHRLKFAVSNVLLKLGFIGKGIYHIISKIKSYLKGVVYRNNIFEALGFNYLGPVDGHDIAAMESLFKIAKDYHRPTVVHVVTKKGKGYTYAEASPNEYHGVSPFDIDAGATPSKKNDFSSVAGQTLCDLAKDNPKICAVTAAMMQGTGLETFSKDHHDRFFDVGIAEEHAVTFACGLASGGMIPFFAVYSSFLQRGYDQVLHDAAIANIPLKLLVDRAGLVGEDGETHQGLFDVAFLSTIPNVNIYSPYCYSELAYRIKETAGNSELAAIRYPRGCEIGNYDVDCSGDYSLIRAGSQKLLITYGRTFSFAVEAAKKLSTFDILKLNKIFPLNKNIFEIISRYKTVHMFEECVVSGGIGEHIAARLLENNIKCEYSIHGIDGIFVPQQTIAEAQHQYGLDTQSIIEIMR